MDDQDSDSSYSSNSSNIPKLPSEVIEKILERTDGSTLARCRRVNRDFKALVRRLSTNKQIWFQRCKAEIDSDTFLSFVPQWVQSAVLQTEERFAIPGQPRDAWQWFKVVRPPSCQPYVAFRSLEAAGESHHVNGTGPDLNLYQRFDFNWEQLYISWYRNCRGLTSLEWDMNAVELKKKSKEGSVTVLKISGRLVITGHQEGSIHISDPELGTWEWANQHDFKVTDMVVINLYPYSRYHIYEPNIKGTLQSASSTYSHHHHIVSVGHDAKVWICPMKAKQCSSPESLRYVQFETGELMGVKVFGDQLLILRNDIEVTRWKFKYGPVFDPDAPITLVKLEHIFLDLQIVNQFDFWNGYLSTFHVSAGQVHTFDTLTGAFCAFDSLKGLPSPSDKSLRSSHHFKRIFAFFGKLFFLLTSKASITLT